MVNTAEHPKARIAPCAGTSAMLYCGGTSRTESSGMADAHKKHRREKRSPNTQHRTPNTVVFVLSLVAVIFAINFGRQLSGDAYWNLRAGQWILQHRAFPFHDPFSFTANRIWIMSEWGFQVLAWLISRISLNVLVLTAFAFVAGAILVAYRASLERASAPAAFLVAALAAGVAADMVDVRAQVTGLLAFSILVWSVERSARAGRGLSTWLPLLFLVWANFHSSFTAGLALLFLEFAGSLYAAIKNPDTRRFAVPLRNLAVTAGCAIAALANPNGARVYEFPLRTIGHGGMTSMIVEWTSPSFRSLSGAFLGLTILAIMWGIAQRRTPLRPAEVARIGVFLIGALLARRLGPFFALACAPILAVMISSHIEDFLSSRRRSALVYVLLAVVIIGGVLFRAKDIGGRSAFDYVTTSEVFPSEACDFILRENPPGPMFNELNYGSYLIWRLWPKYKVFVDNRNDIYFGGAFDDFARAAIAGGDSSWRSVFDKYGINLVVLAPNSLLSDALTETRDWKLAYRDDKAVVFERLSTR